jgi:hypothetical protein
MNKMKTKKGELDVDFFGGLGPLVKEEEKAISNYFEEQRIKYNKKSNASKNPKNKQPKSNDI